MWAPSDGLSIVDASLRPTSFVRDQTLRSVLTPHLAGDRVRVHLTNRYSAGPMVVGTVSIAEQGVGASLATEPTGLTFGGATTVTIPPGMDVVSDPVELELRSFQPVLVTTYLPDATTFPTGHWTANDTTYYTPPNSGDRSDDLTGDAFTLNTTMGVLASGLDVMATGETSAVVAYGDSITDGFLAGGPISVPQSAAEVGTDLRYTDFLQRRVDSSGRSLSVVNSGVSGSKLTADSLAPPTGRSGLSRLDEDAIAVAGVSDVILQQGINDLGIPPWATYDELVGAYVTAIDRLQTAGIRVHQGTLLPASNAIPDGVTAPFANATRLRLNEWIRHSSPADTIVDFDAALRDPSNTDILDARYAGVDNLHPNAAGYARMAEVVDLAVLGNDGC
ncbi:GDSL-type esterase/lipase family protein [Rhodococcus sp. NBC_00297]|uniref:GDSL-type esterase/lipase family protein n=1 Tax=Rhodococcus sp. NBC_00297 TaxID=2976005 RepID=UPI002E287801|nr:GDSL-type esterase/lipase family protein [Rhodococcus sp. NBC_00297]